MALSPADLSGIIEIMNRLYLEIREVEERFGLQFGNGDFRPRIEYFHDAIRALTSNENDAHQPGGRLSVEFLAYDVRALRYLQTMPLASLHHDGQPRSPHQSVKKAPSSPPAHAKPDRDTKIRLGALYQQYGVLFSALFKPNADQNFRERTDALNELVSQLERVAQLMESKALPRDVRDAAMHVDNNELRDLLLAALDTKGKGDLRPLVKEASKRVDKGIASIDKAHLEYASAQLAMFEEGKDVVKQLAAKGMNLAGRFVESACGLMDAMGSICTATERVIAPACADHFLSAHS